MVTMPRYAFPGSNPSSASPWLYGSLPREAVCTENLTPWLKLLPCQGRQGLTQLLDRPTLYAASFHSMQVHLTVHEGQKPTPYTEGTEPKTCLWNSTEDCAGPPKGAFSPVSLRQTMTLVIRPNQLHGPQPAGQLLGWGPPVQQNLTLHRLFNTPAVAACPKASHTHIYWQLPLSVYTSLHPGSPTLNASALDNKLYTFSPTPDAVIASSNSLFALYNLTTPVALDSSSTMAAKLLESSSSFATAPTDSSKIEDSTAQRCVQPSLTWHQQPNPWDPSGPPLQVQQMLAGRLGDRGTLVLHIRLGASAQSKQEQQRVSSSKDEHASLQQDTQHKQQAQQAQQAQHGQQAQKAQQAQHRQQAQQADNSAGRGGGWHEFCVFQMVPWHFQLLFHTLKLHVDGQVSVHIFGCLTWLSWLMYSDVEWQAQAVMPCDGIVPLTGGCLNTKT